MTTKRTSKKTIGLISKTTLHVHNTVCSFFLAVIHYDANSPNFTFYGSRNKRQRNFLSLSKSGYGSQEFNSKRQGRRQPIIKTSWPGPTNFWFDHCTAFNKSWNHALLRSKCRWGQCVLVMRAVFRICGNQSQPSVQLVEKLATPLELFDYIWKSKWVWIMAML